MRILIVQTTRMGDMIQTSPLICQVRLQYPSAHIAVLSRGLAQTIAERHPDIDEIILYDENAMFHDMRAQDSDPLLKAYESASKIVATLREKQFDLAFNMTHSIASAMLLTLAGVKEVVGAHLSEDWRFVLRGAWTSYFFTSVFSRDYNDLNLCDITRSFAQQAPPCHALKFEIRDEERRYVDALLLAKGVKPGSFIVCMQMGASENNKRWAERRFAELALVLRQRHNATVLLVGVKEEAVLGELFEQFAPGAAVHLFGETAIPQLAALLQRANILVTNDTGTMHVAAMVGCPIALVSVGHVHFRETGPYGEGHVAVEYRRVSLGRSDYVPGAAEERERITPEQVYCAMQLTLSLHGSDHALGLPVLDDPLLADVELHATRFAPDGYLQFYPMLLRPLSARDFVRIAYRAMWLDDLGACNAREAEVETARIILQQYERDSAGLAALAQRLQTTFADLAALAQRGIEHTQTLLRVLAGKGQMAAARELVSALMALDEETRVFSEINPETRPLVLLARFERDNLEGANPQVLAETTEKIYEALAGRARLMVEKITYIARL